MRYCEFMRPACPSWLRRRGGWAVLWMLGIAGAAAAAGLGPVTLPPAVTLEYKLSYGLLSGSGRLEWLPQGPRYTLTMRGSALGLTLLQWSSEGALDARGLAPRRFVDRRLTGPDRIAEIDRQRGVVRYSGYKPEHQGEQAATEGVQDRLSWMVQLPALLAANPALREPGQRITMLVTGARRDVDSWTFVVQGRQRVALDNQRGVETIYLTRDPGPTGGTVSEAWLDPARGYLPVRARLSSRDKDEQLDFVLR